jgi:hypothetical protein
MIEDSSDSGLPGVEDSADAVHDLDFAHDLDRARALANDLAGELAPAFDHVAVFGRFHDFDRALDCARTRTNDLVGDLNLDPALDPTLDLDLDLALQLAFDLDRARARANDLVNDLEFARTLGIALVNDLSRAYDLDRDRRTGRDLDRAHNLDLNSACDLAHDIAVLVERAALHARHLASSPGTVQVQGFGPVGPERAVPARSAVRVTGWVLRWLTAADRPRYREELVGELHELAQAGVSRRRQLGHALRLLARVGALRAALRRPARERAR